MKASESNGVDEEGVGIAGEDVTTTSFDFAGEDWEELVDFRERSLSALAENLRSGSMTNLPSLSLGGL